MLGVAISTVAGRFTIIGWSTVGRHTSATALHTSAAKSSSVPVKLSGEYSYTHRGPGCRAAASAIIRAPATAMSQMPLRSRPNTTRLWVADVEL